MRVSGLSFFLSSSFFVCNTHLIGMARHQPAILQRLLQASCARQMATSAALSNVEGACAPQAARSVRLRPLSLQSQSPFRQSSETLPAPCPQSACARCCLQLLLVVWCEQQL